MPDRLTSLNPSSVIFGVKLFTFSLQLNRDGFSAVFEGSERKKIQLHIKLEWIIVSKTPPVTLVMKHLAMW